MKIIHLLTLLVELIIGALGITDSTIQQKPLVAEVCESTASFESASQVSSYLSFSGLAGGAKESAGIPSEVDKSPYIQVIKVFISNTELRNYIKLFLTNRPWHLS